MCIIISNILLLNVIKVQLAGVAEYTDCISEEGWDCPNEYPGYRIKQSDGEAGALGNAANPFIAIAPGTTLAWSGCSDRVLSMGQIDLNCILMLNWIVWKRSVFINELYLFELLVIYSNTWDHLTLLTKRISSK